MWLLLIAFVAGGLLPFAFAPINIFTLAFFMPAVLLFLWLKGSPGRAFWIGLCFGIGLFGVGSSWVYISIHTFGNASPWLAGGLTALLILVLSLYPAIQGYLIRKLWKNKSDAIVCLCVFPATWVLFEYIRSFLFAGFPFLFLGYTQTDNPLSGLAPLFGVYGLSLVVALISGALVLLTRRATRMQKLLPIGLIILCVAVGFSYHKHYWTKPVSKPIQMSLVQGNVSQQIKWEPKELMGIISKYKSLTEKQWDSRIIVWPEAAVPFFPDQLPTFFDDMAAQAKQHDATLVIGAPLMGTRTQLYYNGLLLLGDSHGSYRKRHLVPFGEYIPLQNIFGALMKKLDIPLSNLTPGPQQQAPLVIDGIPIAAFICYETAFPIETLHEMKGKQLGINIVDDAWFGHSFAAAQQLQMTQMRALETGRYIAVTANTGITAMINPFGQLTDALPIDKTGVLVVKATAMAGNTPLMRWGYYPVISLIILLLLLSILRKHVGSDHT